ncbi:MAG: helix-turn-helix transcriptional regulator [Actinomycetales bacterium]
MSGTRIDRTERLLDLLLCLVATARPVTRATIREVVPGYGDAPSDAAFERMFERDKDELRGMGIPIETVTDAGGDVEGYRASRDWALTEVRLNPAELAVISVAASVWDEAILAAPARNALRKLEAVQQDPVRTLPDGVGIRLQAQDAALLPLLAALRETKMVAFDYRAANGDEVVRRQVDPWGIVARDGHWYLVGHDRDRQDVRVYRLSRIEGTVTVTAQPQSEPAPPGTDVAAMVGQMSPEQQATARVRVRAGAGAGLRRHQSVDPFMDAEIEVAAATRGQLVGRICAAADGAVALEPADLVDEIRQVLISIRDQHRPQDGR